ncbi:MAG: B12-binding domain-containing radical SAM protein, partial [bacterium]
MKVLLINPPSRQLLVGNNPKFLDEERGYNPPLGLLYIGTALAREGSHQVRVLDALVEELDYDALRTEIASEKPDVVGITAMSFTLLDVIKVVSLVKKVLPEAVVVLGGPHVYLYPEETLRLEGVDYLIVGEGEFAFLEFMEFLEGKRKRSSVSGLVCQEDGQIKKNAPAVIENVDEISLPDRTLLPYRKYNSLLFAGTPVTTMFTSRGCPYKCTFCDRPFSPVLSGFRWR